MKSSLYHDVYRDDVPVVRQDLHKFITTTEEYHVLGAKTKDSSANWRNYSCFSDQPELFSTGDCFYKICVKGSNDIVMLNLSGIHSVFSHDLTIYDPTTCEKLLNNVPNELKALKNLLKNTLKILLNQNKKETTSLIKKPESSSRFSCCQTQ
jgi:hypothetical protein